LAVAHLFGGPPWVALGVVACIAQVMVDFRLRPLLNIVPALGWLAASRATGNRELFFPYAMYLAAHVASQFAGRGWKPVAAAGGTVVAAFLAIRVLQDATLQVLAVELVVAVAILAAVTALLAATGKRPWDEVVLATLASFAAYAGLAF
jgi:hypothetical protein